MCEGNKMQIKKRFGPRSFVDYLHLNDVYSIGTKPQKQQQVFLKGGQHIFTKHHRSKESIRDSKSLQHRSTRTMEAFLWGLS